MKQLERARCEIALNRQILNLNIPYVLDLQKVSLYVDKANRFGQISEHSLWCVLTNSRSEFELTNKALA